TGLDGVVQKGGMHGFPHGIVAAEGEGDVGNAAADMAMGQVSLYPAGRFDEIDRVIVVLFQARGNGEDVGIENDVFGGEPDLVHQDAVAALADLDAAL